MKKTTLLQSGLSYVIATLGHLDTFVIADAGLPILAETMRIDLALTQGLAGAVQTPKVVLDEMTVERVILAEPAKDHNPRSLAEVKEHLPGVRVEFLSHSEFKARTTQARAVVRTRRKVRFPCQCDFGVGGCFLIERVHACRVVLWSTNEFSPIWIAILTRVPGQVIRSASLNPDHIDLQVALPIR